MNHMSDFCNIVLQKWRGLSEKTMLSFLFSKSLPQIWDTIMPSVHKSVRNLGHDYARCA